MKIRNSRDETIGTILAFIVIFALVACIEFLVWYFVIYVICWAFMIPFSFKYVFGAWAISIVVKMILPSKK